MKVRNGNPTNGIRWNSHVAIGSGGTATPATAIGSGCDATPATAIGCAGCTATRRHHFELWISIE